MLNRIKSIFKNLKVKLNFLFEKGSFLMIQIEGLNLMWALELPIYANYYLAVLTTHRLAYLCCQYDASLDMKLALVLVVAKNER